MKVEVILCKDCIHRGKVIDPDEIGGFGIKFPDTVCPFYCDDEYYNILPKDDFYCKYGNIVFLF